MCEKQIYSSRDHCIICKSRNVTNMFEVDTQVPISLRVYDKPSTDVHFVPYNVMKCDTCFTYQTKYIGDLELIYSKNHVDSFGSVKNEMHVRFAEFVARSDRITGILEVGASTDALATELRQRMSAQTPYCVVDPDFRGDRKSIKVYDDFIENINFDDVEGNTIVMSNVFEHMYSPVDVLAALHCHPRNRYIFMNHPNLGHCCVNDIYQILNIEHTFYIENDFVIKMFNNAGYTCVERKDYETHSIFFKFERTDAPVHLQITNLSSDKDVSKYFERMHDKVTVINALLKDTSKKVYMWPASVHTTSMFATGLEYTKLAGLLDNSPSKIGKFFYGYNLECFSLNDRVRDGDENTVIILGGSDCYLKELSIGHTNAKIIYLHNLQTGL